MIKSLLDNYYKTTITEDEKILYNNRIFSSIQFKTVNGRTFCIIKKNKNFIKDEL